MLQVLPSVAFSLNELLLVKRYCTAGAERKFFGKSGRMAIIPMGLEGWPFTGTQLLDFETNEGIEANGMIFLKLLN